VPSQETLNAFVAAVEREDYVGAIERFYTPDASMQENHGTVRKGRETLMEGEKGVVARFKAIHARCIRPVLVEGDFVVVRWQFDFESKDGTQRKLDELAYQRWQGEKIAEERFYYDPGQMRG
jgi:ketosteroid isomerase-like protein